MLRVKRTVLCQTIFLCCLVCAPISAFAAGKISLFSSNGTFFTLLASGFEAPSGFQITVTYDVTRLSNPRLTQGTLTSGGMFAQNTTVPGSIQFGVVSHPPMKGDGPIVTISFDRAGDSSGNLGVSGLAISQTGTLPVNFSGWSDGGGSSSTDPGSTGTTAGGTGTTGTGTGTTLGTGTTTTGGVATGIGLVGGTLTMPSDDPGTRERKDAPVQPAPAAPPPVQQEPRDGTVTPLGGPEAPAAPEAPVANKKAPEEQPQTVQSVLEKFRLFAGEKTLKNFTALFDLGQGTPFRQTPSVCITDGKSSLKITISKVAGDRAPNFAFNHAKYLSLRQTGDGEWQVEIMPEKGAVRASISMVTEATQQEIPLTVAPQADVDLDKSGSVTESDFQLFLKTRGTDGAPKFDLNGDGKRDYQDDYIFTANYLVKATKEKKDLAPAPKKAE